MEIVRGHGAPREEGMQNGNRMMFSTTCSGNPFSKIQNGSRYCPNPEN
jgi:hypothetical protein